MLYHFLLFSLLLSEQLLLRLQHGRRCERRHILYYLRPDRAATWRGRHHRSLATREVRGHSLMVLLLLRHNLLLGHLLLHLLHCLVHLLYLLLCL